MAIIKQSSTTLAISFRLRGGKKVTVATDVGAAGVDAGSALDSADGILRALSQGATLAGITASGAPPDAVADELRRKTRGCLSDVKVTAKLAPAEATACLKRAAESLSWEGCATFWPEGSGQKALAGPDDDTESQDAAAILAGESAAEPPPEPPRKKKKPVPAAVPAEPPPAE